MAFYACDAVAMQRDRDTKAAKSVAFALRFKPTGELYDFRTEAVVHEINAP